MKKPLTPLDQLKKFCPDNDPQSLTQALQAQQNDVGKALAMLIASGSIKTTISAWMKWSSPINKNLHLFLAARRLNDSRQAGETRREALAAGLGKTDSALRRSLKEWLSAIPHRLDNKHPDAEKLQELCGCKIADCSDALFAANGDLTRALGWIIQHEQFALAIKLDPASTTDEHWSLLEVKRELEGHEFSKALPKPRLRALQQQLAGKRPLDREFVAAGRKARAKALRQSATTKIDDTLTIQNWEGRAILPAWKGFQSRGGGYTSLDSSRPSTGALKVEFSEMDSGAPAREQIAAWKFIVDNDTKVRNAILRAVFARLKTFRKQWEDPDDFPKIRTLGELALHIGPGTIFIFDFARGGVAFTGFEMGCTWDEEHGLGVFLHKDRVLDVGRADAADGSGIKDVGKPIKG